MHYQQRTKLHPLTTAKELLDNRFNHIVQRSLSKSKEKYRYSMAVQTRFCPPKNPSHNENRFSMSIGINSKPPKLDLSSNSNKTMQNIRNTLTLLQSKIDSAKEELKGNLILGRSIIEESDNEESRTLELFSFNESERSRHDEADRRSHKDRGDEHFSCLKVEMVDLKKVKSYYKAEIAKIFMSGNERAEAHLTQIWQVIKNLKGASEPNPEKSNKKALPKNQRSKDMKTLILSLDETLIYCQQQRKSSEDIDISLCNEKGQPATYYLSIRPHAISFLKKMCKKFEVIVFSIRSQKDTNKLLDELDPLNEFISHRLSKEDCFELRPKLWAKNLRVIPREISEMIIVDSSPLGYICHLDNGVPILPYKGGSDSQLYSLQKYLQDLSKSNDVRLPNPRYFQLQKYPNFSQPLEAAKYLYFLRE